MTTYAVQRFVDGAWEDAGDYPDTEGTTISHARDRTRYDGVPTRAIVRETDAVLAQFQAEGFRNGAHWHTTKVRRVKQASAESS